MDLASSKHDAFLVEGFNSKQQSFAFFIGNLFLGLACAGYAPRCSNFDLKWSKIWLDEFLNN